VASTFTNLLYHVVYSTKYRRKHIVPQLRERLYEYVGGIIREKDGKLLRIGGTADHVHILAKLSPSFAISDVLRHIKTNSGKWVNEGDIVQKRFDWQTGYGAFSVSESQVDKVESYIQSQEGHHKHKTFKEEFIELLKRHNIDFDPRYLFEEEHID